MNIHRFRYKYAQNINRGIVWAIILIIGVIYSISTAVADVSLTVAEQQEILLENAVRRSAVQCYAIEGEYPADLEYLISNYNLYYDIEKYVVHYQNIGGNLLPEISVFYMSE